MLRLACRRPTVRALPRTRLVNPVPVRSYANRDAFDEREKSLEDKNVRDHERRLLDDMAKQLDKKKGVAPVGDSLEQTRDDIQEQLLQLRKEMLGEIREIQDSVAELSFRVKRLESKR